MTALIFLIPIALLLGLCGVGAFFWALRDRQFDDPQGAAQRILLDDDLEDHAQRRKVSR
jgi:cbb3-type cytochrome oxidase maturation protein